MWRMDDNTALLVIELDPGAGALRGYHAGVGEGIDKVTPAKAGSCRGAGEHLVKDFLAVQLDRN